MGFVLQVIADLSKKRKSKKLYCGYTLKHVGQQVFFFQISGVDFTVNYESTLFAIREFIKEKSYGDFVYTYNTHSVADMKGILVSQREFEMKHHQVKKWQEQ